MFSEFFFKIIFTRRQYNYSTRLFLPPALHLALGAASLPPILPQNPNPNSTTP